MSRHCGGIIGGGPDDPTSELEAEAPKKGGKECPECGEEHEGYTCQQAAEVAERL